MEKESSLSIIICENLPLDLTIHEKKGCCQKPNSDCKYNRLNLDPDLQLCHKKTYTPRSILSSVT